MFKSYFEQHSFLFLIHAQFFDPNSQQMLRSEKANRYITLLLLPDNRDEVTGRDHFPDDKFPPPPSHKVRLA